MGSLTKNKSQREKQGPQISNPDLFVVLLHFRHWSLTLISHHNVVNSFYTTAWLNSWLRLVRRCWLIFQNCSSDSSFNCKTNPRFKLMCSFKYVIISKATKYTFVEWLVDIPHKQIKKKNLCNCWYGEVFSEEMFNLFGRSLRWTIKGKAVTLSFLTQEVFRTEDVTLCAFSIIWQISTIYSYFNGSNYVN